ncbi:MAG: selenocysteine-specific translation elongation factor [Thermoleophilia bacterium]|nr:selenocysteine-specific translation elongation factor [Thermoleophilia bacterium]
MTRAPLVLGTAGHIDHGKTSLVRALTGRDTDRLPEERERGISIDLGYAPLELPDGRQLSVVDVPGHERFVRAMVAGATGIDLFLLVIDAGEGARPQTHEHLAIIRLLGIGHGVAAVTKADAVDAETLELALDEARELAPGSEAVAVSARTGAGLDELVAALARVADRVERRQPLAATRLFADRSFSLHGIGTVVTGTLWSGSIGTGDELELAPAGRRIRVRSVQVHERAVDRAPAGQRVAVSLPGVERGEVRRGDALVAPGAFPVSYRLDVLLLELPGSARDRALPAHATVHVHHGTAEHLARLVRVGERYAQLRLATPAVAARGDRLVLREQTTVGGGIVLDPAPPRRPSEERLALLERGDPESIVLGILDAAPEPLSQQDLARRALLSPEDVERGLAAAVRAGAWCLTPARFDAIATRVAHRLTERAATSPLDPGIPLAELLPPRPWAPAVLSLLPLERRGAKAYAKGASARLGDRAGAAGRLEAQLAASGLAAVQLDDPELAVYLERAGRLVRLADGLVVSAEAYASASALVVEECEAAGSITLARFRDLAGTGRRIAQLVLERLDADGVTRRAGDARVLRRRGRAGGG